MSKKQCGGALTAEPLDNAEGMVPEEKRSSQSLCGDGRARRRSGIRTRGTLTRCLEGRRGGQLVADDVFVGRKRASRRVACAVLTDCEGPPPPLFDCLSILTRITS